MSRRRRAASSASFSARNSLPSRMKRYRQYSEYLKDIFGCRVRKISVDAGFSCPNRDGSLSTGGCAFCDNAAFTTSYCDPSLSISEQLSRGIAFHKARHREADAYLAYFQSYSNTYAETQVLRRRYREALSSPQICGLVLATRPDCIDERKLDLLAELARDRYILVEYGVESLSGRALELCGRGHDTQASLRAIRLTAERGIRTGAHLIFGLPGETRTQMLQGLELLNTLPLDTVKFHQLQILKGSRFEAEYKAAPERFELFSEGEYLEFLVEALRRLNPAFVPERLFNEVPPRYLVAPVWNAGRSDALYAKLDAMMEELDARQGDSAVLAR